MAAAASPQLLQAAIRRHTPSTTDVVPPPPSAGVGKFMEEKGTASLHPLPTPDLGEGGECSEPEGVSRKAAFLLTGI